MNYIKESNMVLRKNREVASEKKKRKKLGQRGNYAQLWMCLVVRVKSDAVKNNISQERGMFKQETTRVNIDI